jgi:hypothetical protein
VFSLFEAAQLPSEISIVMLVYLDRMLSNAKFTIFSANWARMVDLIHIFVFCLEQMRLIGTNSEQKLHAIMNREDFRCTPVGFENLG